jgi:CRP/FNR family cyclic AMP-dependent transcriptional regulator
VPCSTRNTSFYAHKRKYEVKESKLVITISQITQGESITMRTASTLSRSQVRMVLSKIPFFREFSSEERERVADEQGGFHIARHGEFIIRQGSQERAFYILLSGACCVRNEGSDSDLARLKPGDVFGEIGFLSEQARTSHVIAEEPSILLRIDLALMSRFRPEVREKIKDQLILRLLERLPQLS